MNADLQDIDGFIFTAEIAENAEITYWMSHNLSLRTLRSQR
jgi:acetate kinase